MRKYIVFILLLALQTASAITPFGNAKWIGATSDINDTMGGKSIVLSKTLQFEKKVSKAEIYVCGLGQYQLYLNGSKVSDDVFAPAWSDYRKTVFYNRYDVTKQLTSVSGDLRVSVMLGNGFYYEDGKRYHKLKSRFGPLTLLLHLHVDYEDGTQQEVITDKDWQWCLSPVTFNSIYGGEDYDARLEDSMPWNDAIVQSAPYGVLTEQIAPPVRIMERYGIKSVHHLTEGEIASASMTTKRDIAPHAFVLDMGQNLSGFPEIRVKGKRGQKITLIVGETLTKEGACDQRQTGRPHYYTYTLRGNEPETWHPAFSYYGFRYIQVEGAVMQDDVNSDGLPVLQDIKSCFIYNSSPTIGSFSCSNPLFNDTYRIIDRAIRSNWQSVWTDCPHREKLGWMEQDWLNAEGLMDNYDCRKMIEQTMILLADAQHDDGSLPEIAPEYVRFEGPWAKPFLESPEWGGALIALPYLYAGHYSDNSLIQKYLPEMIKYVDYLATRDSSYILNMGLGDWYDYGPGKAGFAKNTPVSLVSTAHYYLWTQMVAMVAKKYGNKQKAKTLLHRADSIRQAFLETFKLQSQSAYAIALEMGLYRKGEKQLLLQRLVDDIHQHGDRLTTGDVGTRYLFRSLLHNGNQELLYKMLNHDGVPGYGYQLKKGMTTLAEQWDPDLGASRNHFMLAHINNHLIHDMVGINVNGNTVVVEPKPVGDLTWAKGETMIGKDKIQVSWKCEGKKFLLDVIAPRTIKVTLKDEEVNRFCSIRGFRLQYERISAE